VIGFVVSSRLDIGTARTEPMLSPARTIVANMIWLRVIAEGNKNREISDWYVRKVKYKLVCCKE
jgi:hypothetical protein